MTNADYPYSGASYSCRREKVDERAKYRTAGWTRIGKDVADLMETVKEGPMSIGIDASCNAFRWYKSGIVKYSDCPGGNMDHSVTLVGFNYVGKNDFD